MIGAAALAVSLDLGAIDRGEAVRTAAVDVGGVLAAAAFDRYGRGKGGAELRRDVRQRQGHYQSRRPGCPEDAASASADYHGASIARAWRRRNRDPPCRA